MRQVKDGLQAESDQWQGANIKRMTTRRQAARRKAKKNSVDKQQAEIGKPQAPRNQQQTARQEEKRLQASVIYFIYLFFRTSGYRTIYKHW